MWSIDLLKQFLKKNMIIAKKKIFLKKSNVCEEEDFNKVINVGYAINYLLKKTNK